jgi:tRNA(Ile)-lysidine synthase
MVLLQLLGELAPLWRLQLFAAHLHHGLRGREADLDAALVRDYCRRQGVPLLSARTDVRALARRRRLSIETAAREARYAFLRRTAVRIGAVAVALGHTADDQVETFLMRLLRGAGWPGLGAMRPVREEGHLRIIRPLLGTWRTEVLAVAAARGIGFRLDRSNKDIAFLRNRVRRRLIPYLRREYNPNVKEILRRCSEIIGEGHEFARSEATRLFRAAARVGRSEIAIPVERFLAAPGVLRAELLRLSLSRLGAEGVPGYAETTAIADLCMGQRGYKICRLPGGVTASREYGKILLSRAAAAGPGYEILLRDGAELRLPLFHLRFGIAPANKRRVPRSSERRVDLAAVWGEGGEHFWPLVQYVSADALRGRRLVVRNRREGDRYRPRGVRGTKRLARIMIDEKLPLPLRRVVPVIACGEEIVWLPGHRIAEGWRVIPATRRVLKLTVEKAGEM